MPTTSSQTSPRLSSAPSRGAIAAWLAIAVLLIALGFVGASSGETDRNILYDYAFAAGSVVIYGILVGVTLVIASRLGRPSRPPDSKVSNGVGSGSPSDSSCWS